MARSMLSFGIEYERALSTAFWSARLLAGSPPPSFVATMIERASFEKSLPRFASAAPFLCLIDDHLLCPDTAALLDGIEEERVEAGVVGQLGVKGDHEEAPLPRGHGMALERGEHLDPGADILDPRRPDEHCPQRRAQPRELEIGLERGDLATERVAAHRDVDEPEVVAVEHDHAGAGAEHRRLERADRVVET